MDLELDGKVFVVSGGTRGLGRATAELLVAEGARVAVSGRDAARAEAAAGALGESAIAVAADNADPQGAERLVGAAVHRWGRLDGALISVGGPPAGSALETPESEWAAAFESVFLGALRLARTVSAAMTGPG